MRKIQQSHGKRKPHPNYTISLTAHRLPRPPSKTTITLTLAALAELHKPRAPK